MHIIYPYNEILPKKTAHDVYVFQNVLSMAKEGCHVQLLCGKGSIVDEDMRRHYNAPDLYELKIHRLPILRKNNIFSLSWNRVFLFFSQKFIQKRKADALIVSVLKQGEYHFSRKTPKTLHVYEAHQLQWYPHMELEDKQSEVKRERLALSKADLIVVTTKIMKEILRSPPYLLKNPIEILPLAVDAPPLPFPKNPIPSAPPKAMYIGQLYRGQGIRLLLEALEKVPEIHLEIIGGTPEEVSSLKTYAEQLKISNRILFHGFVPPSQLAAIARRADAFVAPFESSGRMPYVAHTKLLEYYSWNRPVIAPDMPIVREHFPENTGCLYFEAGNTSHLAERLHKLKDESARKRLQSESASRKENYTWDERSKRYHQILSRYRNK